MSCDTINGDKEYSNNALITNTFTLFPINSYCLRRETSTGNENSFEKPNKWSNSVGEKNLSLPAILAAQVGSKCRSPGSLQVFIL